MALRQVSMDEELPPDGSEEEAQALVRQMPLRMPSFELKRVNIAQLQVDYAPPHGDGYARPLSEGRMKVLRRDWDSMACSPLIISKRRDGSLYVVDGNHRRVIAYEKGITSLPAMIFSDLERTREADLYTKLGTVLGQTPWTRFQSKLVAGDQHAQAIVRIADAHGLEVSGAGYLDGRIQAVARLEWIYARGGPDGLDWTLDVLGAAFDGHRESLGEMQLEGAFSFYQRYADKVAKAEVITMLAAGGLMAWHDRAASIWGRIDVGKRSNTYGMAIADMLNDAWRKKGKKTKELLPAWRANLSQPAPGMSFSSRMNWSSKPGQTPAPQQLAES